MTKFNHISTIAIATALFAAGPAFADDHKMKNDADMDAKATMEMKKIDAKMKMETEVQLKTGETMTNDVAPVHVNDTVGEVLQSNGDILPEADNDALMAAGTERNKDVLISVESDNEIASNAIVVPTIDAKPVTTVTCPVGTTAQPDMTCLITGNYMGAGSK
ncbi:MAG: hypothetical protein EX271_01540 [Acidimicrobiales bacterium]|nr:hypothetical protein [Hyphomonadaceae bacterium]RZV44496.1 MAG: hypothetical protein EX271_01540 [Acidimicrobiales bacterium]